MGRERDWLLRKYPGNSQTTITWMTWQPYIPALQSDFVSQFSLIIDHVSPLSCDNVCITADEADDIGLTSSSRLRKFSWGASKRSWSSSSLELHFDCRVSVECASILSAERDSRMQLVWSKLSQFSTLLIGVCLLCSDINSRSFRSFSSVLTLTLFSSVLRPKRKH